MEACGPLKSSNTSDEELEEVKEREEEKEEEEGEDLEAEFPPEDKASEVIATEDEIRFSYFKKGFTTEIYKIEIRNLPTFVGFKVCEVKGDNLL